MAAKCKIFVRGSCLSRAEQFGLGKDGPGVLCEAGGRLCWEHEVDGRSPDMVSGTQQMLVSSGSQGKLFLFSLILLRVISAMVQSAEAGEYW